jgi:putative Ca2+/H+ antiporter (TMEM165/GDT1 family)
LRPTQAVVEWAATASGAFGLIATAEIGDKSQWVCMTLAARHRALPVVLGAACAFALLNLAAVWAGAALAHWISEYWATLAAAVLFALFGLRSLFAQAEALGEDAPSKSNHSVFATTFLLIFLAEFGDKTQLATAGLSMAAAPLPVWAGATLALLFTSALGAWAGRALLQRIPLHWLHRLSGLLFLGFAAFAAGKLGWLG